MFGWRTYRPKEKIEITENIFSYLVNAVLLKLYDRWAGDEERKNKLKPEIKRSLEVLLGKKNLEDVGIIDERLLNDVRRACVGLLIEYQFYYQETGEGFGSFLMEYENRLKQSILSGIEMGYIYKPEGSKLLHVVFP